MADNSATLLANRNAWDQRAGARGDRRPFDGLEGAVGVAQFSGNASTTVFNIAHGLVNAAGNGVTPTHVDVNGLDAVSVAAKIVTKTTANIVVTFTAAPPAAANNINLTWIAVR